jgi:hypothetical protein
MPLTIENSYEPDVARLGPHLAHVLLRSLPAMPDGTGPLRLIGPIPVFAGREADIARGRTRLLQHLGWRGLLLDSADAPIACVDFATHQGASPAYGVDGPIAARALYDALQAAEAFAETTPQRYRLRLLRLDRILVAGLWLQGRHTKVILVRDGVTGPPGSDRLARSEFLRLVEHRQASSRR